MGQMFHLSYAIVTGAENSFILLQLPLVTRLLPPVLTRAGAAPARRIGELIPPEKQGGKPDRGSKSRNSGIAFPESQRLSEFRKLAEIPRLGRYQPRYQPGSN